MIDKIILILSVVLYLIIALLVANLMQEIVELKGHETKKYWWCTFILLPIGILMVIALTDNRVYYSLQYICSKLDDEKKNEE